MVNPSSASVDVPEPGSPPLLLQIDGRGLLAASLCQRGGVVELRLFELLILPLVQVAEDEGEDGDEDADCRVGATAGDVLGSRAAGVHLGWLVSQSVHSSTACSVMGRKGCETRNSL